MKYIIILILIIIQKKNKTIVDGFDTFNEFAGFNESGNLFKDSNINDDVPKSAKEKIFFLLKECRKFDYNVLGFDQYYGKKSVDLYKSMVDERNALQIGENLTAKMQWTTNTTFEKINNNEIVDYIPYWNNKIYKELFKYYPLYFLKIENKTYELCQIALGECGNLLEYIQDQTNELCLIAVNNDGMALKFVKKQTEKLCRNSIKQNYKALEFVENKNAEIYNYALSIDYRAIEFIYCQTENIGNYVIDKCLENQNYDVVKFIDNASEEKWIKLMSVNGMVLKHVKDQTDNRCVAAIN
jgi:hypothetical protein